MQFGNGFRPFFIPFFWLISKRFFCWGWIWPATPFGWYFVKQIFLPFWCFPVFPIINCSQEWSSRMTNLWTKAHTFVDQASQNIFHNFDIGLNKHVLRKCPSYFILLPLVLSYCPTYLSIFHWFSAVYQYISAWFFISFSALFHGWHWHWLPSVFPPVFLNKQFHSFNCFFHAHAPLG